MTGRQRLLRALDEEDRLRETLGVGVSQAKRRKRLPLRTALSSSDGEAHPLDPAPKDPPARDPFGLDGDPPPLAREAPGGNAGSREMVRDTAGLAAVDPMGFDEVPAAPRMVLAPAVAPVVSRGGRWKQGSDDQRKRNEKDETFHSTQHRRRA